MLLQSLRRTPVISNDCRLARSFADYFLDVFETLLQVESRLYPDQFAAHFDESDGNGGLHTRDDRLASKDSNHRRDVVQDSSHVGVDHIDGGNFYYKPRCSCLGYSADDLVLQLNDLVVAQIFLNRDKQHIANSEDRCYQFDYASTVFETR